MCFGTFDNFHPGHRFYLEQAKKYGDYLIVIVARDYNVAKIKGRGPKEIERERQKKIAKIDFVDKAVLGRIKDKYAVIKKYKPSIICLGYDQEVNLKELKSVFLGKIIRLKSYKEDKYKSSLINCKSKALNNK